MTCVNDSSSPIYDQMDLLTASPPLQATPMEKDLNWYYTSFEILVGVVAVFGNALVIAVFSRERRLRRRTNYYIVSLAVADLLVGLLGIPFAILTSVGLPAASIHTCLFTVSLLMVLCTISIFSLVAVSVDRYWAILHPMDYSRNVRTRTALVIIAICWFSGSFIGFIPLMGWHKEQDSDILKCYFLDVMDYNYLVFAYFATIIAPALLLAVFYIHIYHVVLKQIRRMRTLDNNIIEHSPSRGSGTMLRVLGAAQKREVKATQNLSIIVLFFMVCWIPLYTINCTLAFCGGCEIPDILMNSCIILSHANSAGNPLLYAYHLRDFREAMKRFILYMVGIKTQPYLIRPNGSQVTTFSTYCQQHRCRSQPYLPQIVQNKSLAQSRSEVPFRHIAALRNQDMDICSSAVKLGDHPTDVSLHQNATSAIVRNTVNLASMAVQNKRDLWRISSSSECDLPSISGESNSSDFRHQDKYCAKYPKSKLFEKLGSDAEMLSLVYPNMNNLKVAAPKQKLNKTFKPKNDVFSETVYPFFTNDLDNDISNLTRSNGMILSSTDDFKRINDSYNRSKSCFNIQVPNDTQSNSSLDDSMKPRSVFHIGKEMFSKQHSASATFYQNGTDTESNAKYASVENLTL